MKVQCDSHTYKNLVEYLIIQTIIQSIFTFDGMIVSSGFFLSATDMLILYIYR